MGRCFLALRVSVVALGTLATSPGEAARRLAESDDEYARYERHQYDKLGNSQQH